MYTLFFFCYDNNAEKRNTIRKQAAGSHARQRKHATRKSPHVALGDVGRMLGTDTLQQGVPPGIRIIGRGRGGALDGGTPRALASPRNQRTPTRRHRESGAQQHQRGCAPSWAPRRKTRSWPQAGAVAGVGGEHAPAMAA